MFEKISTITTRWILRIKIRVQSCYYRNNSSFRSILVDFFIPIENRLNKDRILLSNLRVSINSRHLSRSCTRVDGMRNDASNMRRADVTKRRGNPKIDWARVLCLQSLWSRIFARMLSPTYPRAIDRLPMSLYDEQSINLRPYGITCLPLINHRVSFPNLNLESFLYQRSKIRN